VRLFISYRRDDSPDIAGRIHDRLVEKFSAENVYYDVDSIEFGVDFREQIDSMVRDCDVVLVVIGPLWFQIEAGRRQIDDPGDFVRVEVEAALQRDIRVVPTLVRGAGVPSPKDLPESIRALAYRHGLQVRQDPDFHGDMTRLISSLTTPPRRQPPPEGTTAPAPAPRPPAATRRPPLRSYWTAALAAAAILVVASLVIWRTAVNTGSVTAPDASGLPGTETSPASGTFAVSGEFNTDADPADLEVDGADLLVSFGSGVLQQIDPRTGEVKSSIDFGYPGGNDLLADSNEIAVTLRAGARVGFVDRPFGPSETIEIAGGQPLNGAIAPDGFWFACHTTEQSGFLAHVSGRQEVGRIPVNFAPDGLLEDGDHLYVTAYGQGLVGKVDVKTGVVQTANVGTHPVDLAIVGGDLWVTLSESDEVVVLDPESLTIKARHSVGARPWKLAVGLGSVWITSQQTPDTRGTVSRIDPDTGQRRQPDIVVGVTPDEIAISDALIYIGNRGSNSVSILSAD
jgi:YVTN family beta-propeller protein